MGKSHSIYSTFVPISGDVVVVEQCCVIRCVIHLIQGATVHVVIVKIRCECTENVIVRLMVALQCGTGVTGNIYFLFIGLAPHIKVDGYCLILIRVETYVLLVVTSSAYFVNFKASISMGKWLNAILILSDSGVLETIAGVP